MAGIKAVPEKNIGDGTILSLLSRSRYRLAGQAAPEYAFINSFFAVAPARRGPTGSQRTVTVRPERKGRREERMSIRHQMR